MAHTAAGVLLTERHRVAQLQLDSITQADLRRIWPAFDPNAIDRSWDTLSPALEALVQSRRDMSSSLSAAYFEEIRAAETATSSHPTIRLADPVPAADLTGTLRFTGPITAKQLASAGATDIAAATFDMTAGNVTRLVLNGGRETLTSSIQSDRRTLGYARVSDQNPCAFCAMLIARGAVYGAASADFPAHRSCGCTAEPVFSEDPVLPPGTEEIQTLWTESTKGLSGREARQAFRRAHEAR